MKRKPATVRYGAAKSQSQALREPAPVLEFPRLSEPALVVSVRAAKDQLSSLLEAAAKGDEVIITSDGLPKAKLVPVQAMRRPFRVDWGLLRSMPVSTTGPTAEEAVRTDRDGREW